MTIYFTSDTHFGHKNIIKYSKRPYANVDEMNEALISNWNRRVQPQDSIYHLGDFAFMKESELENVLRRLNGKKYLIWGNHDQTIQDSQQLQSYFEWCKDYHELKFDNKLFVLCHYPMITWNKAHHESFMLHGHCHGSLRYPQPPKKIWDVGVDPNQQIPISIGEVQERFKNFKFNPVDHHGD